MTKRKLTRRETFLILSPLPFLLLISFALSQWMRDAAYFLNPFGEGIEKSARLAAGFGASDCARVEIEDAYPNSLAKIEAVDACAASSFKARRPFRVRYDYNKPPRSDYASYGVTDPRIFEYRIYTGNKDGEVSRIGQTSAAWGAALGADGVTTYAIVTRCPKAFTQTEKFYRLKRIVIACSA